MKALKREQVRRLRQIARGTLARENGYVPPGEAPVRRITLTDAGLPQEKGWFTKLKERLVA
jgi:hypothetical protein